MASRILSGASRRIIAGGKTIGLSSCLNETIRLLTLPAGLHSVGIEGTPQMMTRSLQQPFAASAALQRCGISSSAPLQYSLGTNEISAGLASNKRTSFSIPDYPTPSNHQMSFRQSFAKSNSSFLSCNGKAFVSSVLRVTGRQKLFLVDAGLGTPINCLQNELAGVPINRVTRFENKVGFQNVVTGEPLLLPRKFRQARAWMEMKKIWQTNRKVKGFLLNKVYGGYSVAVAGFVTLLPWMTTRKKNVWRARYTIARLHPKRQNVVVCPSS